MKPLHLSLPLAFILLLSSVFCSTPSANTPPITQPDSLVDSSWVVQQQEFPVRISKIAPPDGYTRVVSAVGSFAHYLQNQPLKTDTKTVYLYDGTPKGNQSAQYAVLDIDVGKRDLQQCADAIMRLRAEYLYANHQKADIHFNFTSGHRADYQKYAQGYRPQIKGSNVSWAKTASADTSYKAFRKYMDVVFMYAGTHSLSKELTAVASVGELQIGDVFIQGGFPGHAVIVVDMAVAANGTKAFVLAQSYMPAQDIHILLNPMADKKTPWYTIQGATLYTPEWTFLYSNLKRFGGE